MSSVVILKKILSILKQSNVACRFYEWAHVVSLILFLMSLGSMLHIDFKKSLCRPVEFRDQGPSY